VKKILQRRGMKLDTKCCMCGRLDEDGGHLFLKCKEAKCIWWELNLEMVGCHLLLAESARAMMEEILKLEPKTQLAVVLLLWLWWSERNKWREEGRRRTAVVLWRWTKQLCQIDFCSKPARSCCRKLVRHRDGPNRVQVSSRSIRMVHMIAKLAMADGASSFEMIKEQW
jgi:hypothetical protein